MVDPAALNLLSPEQLRALAADLLTRVRIQEQDHLPLYRQEAIFGRAGLPIPRSSLAQWVGPCGAALQPVMEALKAELLTHAVLHADETPVAMLKPGTGRTHRAYLWALAATKPPAPTFASCWTPRITAATRAGSGSARPLAGLPPLVRAAGKPQLPNPIPP